MITIQMFALLAILIVCIVLGAVGGYLTAVARLSHRTKPSVTVIQETTTQQLTLRNAYLTVLYDVTLDLINRLDLNSLLSAILERAARLLDANDGYIYLANAETGQMTIKVAIGTFKNYIGDNLESGDGIAGQSWRTGEIVAVDDYATCEFRHPWRDQSAVHASICAPLKSDGRVIGILGLTHKDSARRINADEIDVIGHLSNLAALAIVNAWLYTETQRELAQRAAVEADLLRLNRELELRVRKRTAEIEHGNNLIRAIFNGMGEGMVYSQNKEILYTNRAMTALTGYPIEELVGQPMGLLVISEEGLPQRQDFEPGTIWRGETRLRRKDGSTFDAALTTSLFVGPDASYIGSVSIVRDITTEKQLQMQKMRFIANASHELRTPLTSIKTRLYLLRKQPDRIEDHMSVLERTTNYMVRLVDDLLEVIRFERGLISIHKQDVMLQELIDYILELEYNEAQRKRIALASDVPDAPIVVKGDQVRLTQALLNLLINAINYTPQGGRVTVRLTLEQRDGQSWAVVHVQDSGIGIAPEDQERIFEPFIRISENESRGTGLGLSIAREIIEMHGGSLTLHSELGKGSDFAIEIALDSPEETSEVMKPDQDIEDISYF